MLRLPKKIGPFTLMRKLGSDGVTESYAGILDEPAGKQVVVRKLATFLLVDPSVRAATEARIQDLKAIRHPTLVPVLDLVKEGEDRYIVEEWVEAVDLRRVLEHCVDTNTELPRNVYLNLATQICNGLEALHGRPGSASGAENVLHLSLKPDAVFVTAAGKLLVGNYGLTATPTALPKAGVSGSSTAQMEYLSPEQTQPEQTLAPASDIFALGAILYEMLTLEALFKAESNLQTIHRVRRAEVTAQLLRVKELLPGLDKVLYRALSLNPRHRYQRAFVLREDLRGLMAGYSFANITGETSAFLAPIFEASEISIGGTPRPEEPGFDDTASILRASLQEAGRDPDGLNQATHGDTDPGHPAYSAPDTAAFVAAARAPRPDNPTLEPTDMEALQRETDPGTTWEQGPGHETPSGAHRRSLLAAGSRGGGDQTTWVPIPQAAPSATPSRDADPPTTPMNELDEERPTEPTGSGASHPPQGLAASVPPPPPRALVEEEEDEPHQGVVHEETTYTDYEWPPRKSRGSGLWIGLGVGAVALIGVIVCGGGIIGGGGWFLRGSGTSEPTTQVAQALPEVEEPAVAEVAPDEAPTTAADPDPEPAPRAAPTRPAPAPRADPAPRPRPVPTRTAAVATPPTPRPAPSLFDEDPEFDPGSFTSGTGDEIRFEAGELSQYSDKAYRGGLSDQERSGLERIDVSDPDYTRAQVLLYQDAKARDDLTAREEHIDAIMSVPENQYNPQFLVEQGEIAIRKEDYGTALERANLAERHWARLPSDLIFTRKAMIYEIQASAYQGRFYESGGEDVEALYQAIRSWEKYQRHVQTQAREDLTLRAEDQLAKLYDMKKRLEGP